MWPREVAVVVIVICILHHVEHDEYYDCKRHAYSSNSLFLKMIFRATSIFRLQPAMWDVPKVR